MQKHTLLQGLQAMPGDGALLAALGTLLEQEGDWSGLREVLLEHLPHLPRGASQEGQLFYLAAKACLELGDDQQAVRLAAKAAALLPAFPYAHHILGRALARVGRCSEAMAAQQRCADLEPSFVWCWFEMGSLALELGDHTHARSAFQQALNRQDLQDPDNTAILRDALERAEQACLWEERERAARLLWPERTIERGTQSLPPIDQLALMTEEFRLFLDKVQPNGAASHARALP